MTIADQVALWLKSIKSEQEKNRKNTRAKNKLSRSPRFRVNSKLKSG